jgi:hypothetical protein
MSSALSRSLLRSRLQSWLLFLLAPFVGIVANLLRVIGSSSIRTRSSPPSTRCKDS